MHPGQRLVNRQGDRQGDREAVTPAGAAILATARTHWQRVCVPGSLAGFWIARGWGSFAQQADGRRASVRP